MDDPRAKLLPELEREFADKDPGEIRACLDAGLSHDEETPIQPYVIPLAAPEARDCLRDDKCALLVSP